MITNMGCIQIIELMLSYCKLLHVLCKLRNTCNAHQIHKHNGGGMMFFFFTNACVSLLCV